MTLSIRALALLQLAVILGIAAGLGFTQWQSEQPTSTSSEASEVVPSLEPPPQVPSPAADLSPAADTPSNDGPQTLAEWLEGEPVPTSTGSGQIGGIVLLDGEPLAELEMTASVVIPTDSDEDDDLLDQLLAGVKSMRLRKSLERTSTSDEGGNFSFEGLDEEYSYHIGAPDHFLSSADRQLRAPYPTGSDLQLNARAKQDTYLTAEGERRRWATGGLDETVLIGTIQNLHRGSLYIVEGHGPLPEPIDQAQRLSLNYSSTSFSKALDPGPYTLAAAVGIIREGKALNSWPIEVKTGINEVHLVVETPPSVEVVVWSASGDPIDNAHFSWLRRSANSRSSAGCRPLKTEGNRYFILPNERILEIFAGGSNTEALLDIGAPGQASVEVPVDRLGTIEVSFDPVSWLDVDVIGYRGSGLEGSLHFTLTSDDGSASSPAMVDWLGALRLGPVPPGRYQLVTSAKTGSSYPLDQITTDSVHLAAGDNAIALTLPLLYELTLDFDDELLGKHGRISSGQNSFPRQFTARRPLVISLLAPGEYVVRVGQMEKTVRIPQQDSVYIAYEKIEINTMVIVQITPGSPAERSGLQVGDQVIAFNGVTFSGMDEMQAIYFKIANDPELTLTIIRNGIEMQLTVSQTYYEGITPRFIER
ncbi:MAG TPA: PDZ domain-containing protein [Planctomycetes bacterium]|nr:PDZ domain-containing protein [Planctomycetota bacterium]HIN80601.1 PDZ domain-containing protein [Planctomycetota bacterium]